MQPAEQVEAGLALVAQTWRPWSVSRLQVALKDSASAQFAELPTALMLWTTPARRQASANARLVH
ncbi:hypothetical protein RM704_09695 [Streptomyces sp. DSM 3412]|uniref:Uncharacterized protein n=1 Tax=Streptomyces gottesmaniae TaxID=3075518 RepID=A0ABU2YX12_9ACTN|nr:hypothetical protein [Streptomyces sp. DSM 3412]MDT0567737.1 hypothetical protein [Streptomyces sp. DSM 3412]